jgi:hypothetical protein
MPAEETADHPTPQTDNHPPTQTDDHPPTPSNGQPTPETDDRPPEPMSDPPRVAVLTTTRDEADMLPRWIAYYGGQVGVENLLVLDDNTTDGSTKDLPCSVYRLPPAPWRWEWAVGRIRLVNGIANGLLACYDFVVFTDVDEFLVPDPAKYDGLRDYLSAHIDQKVIAPIALNVLHKPDKEPDLDPARPVLGQRNHVKFVPGMCKPLLKRIPAPWRPAFHGINAPYEIDRDLLMLHLKYYDVTALRRVAAHRHMLHEEEDRGSASSAWAMGSDELTSQLLSWVETSPLQRVPELKPADLDLEGIVNQKPAGFYRSDGTQMSAMQNNPLLRLPERFTDAF